MTKPKDEPPMDGAELRQRTDEIGWTLRTLAERADVAQSSVQRWAFDVRPIPPIVARWVRLLARLIRDHPLPPRDDRS